MVIVKKRKEKKMKLQKATTQPSCKSFKIESGNVTLISYKGVPYCNSLDLCSDQHPLNFFTITLLALPLTVKSNGRQNLVIFTGTTVTDMLVPCITFLKSEVIFPAKTSIMARVICRGPFDSRIFLMQGTMISFRNLTDSLQLEKFFSFTLS